MKSCLFCKCSYYRGFPAYMSCEQYDSQINDPSFAYDYTVCITDPSIAENCKFYTEKVGD